MLKINHTDINRLNTLIDEAENVVITAHMTPDGDAIGSSCALMHVLYNMGKTAKVILPDAPPASLAFLTAGLDVVIYSKNKEFADLLISKAELIFCLDYNAPKRLDNKVSMSQAILEASAPKVMIDHHEDPDKFCDITLSYPAESSTCMLLFQVICALELVDAIDKDAAECLLAGMMTDTGNFSYNNANGADIYRVVAELVERGANHHRLYKLLFDTFSADCLRLNAYAIDKKMKVWEDKGCALITLSRDELNEYKYKPGYTEGLVNKPLAIPEVAYSVYLREESNYIKVSMRSKGNFPCNIVCEENFNGGGHLNAAGGEVRNATLDQVSKMVEDLLDKNYDKYIKNNKTIKKDQ